MLSGNFSIGLANPPKSLKSLNTLDWPEGNGKHLVHLTQIGQKIGSR